MNKALKIGIIAVAVAGGGFAVYFALKNLSVDPSINVTGIDPNAKTASIVIAGKVFPYKFKPGFLDLGPIGSFYTAQVVSYDGSSQDQADYMDVKLMKSGKLVNTKRVYLG